MFIGKFTHKILVFICMLSFAYSFLPAFSKNTSPIKLQFKGTEGDQARYVLQIYFSPLSKATGKLAQSATSFPFNRLFQFLIKRKVTGVDLMGEMHLTYALNAASIGGAQEESKIPIIEEVLLSTKGKALTLVMAPSGRVSNVEGLEGIKDVNLQETIKSVFSRLHPRFPLAPVYLGGKWQYNETFESKFNTVVGTMTLANNLNTRYTLLGFEEIRGIKCVKILSDITFTQTLPDSLLPIELPFKVNAKVFGKGKGTIYFDPDAGNIVSGEFFITQEGSVTLTRNLALTSTDESLNKKSINNRELISAKLDSTIKIDLEPEDLKPVK